MTATIAIHQDDLRDVIARSVSQKIGREVHANQVSIRVEDKEDFRGDKCGHSVSAVVLVPVEKIASI